MSVSEPSSYNSTALLEERREAPMPSAEMGTPSSGGEVPFLLSELSAEEPCREALQRVDTLRDLEENWDGEDALPVPDATADRAQAFLRQVARAVRQEGREWLRPFIAPDPGGRLWLMWKREGYHHTVIIGETLETVVCVQTPPVGEPTREVISWQVATELLLKMLPCHS